jgi:hypothetical protein
LLAERERVLPWIREYSPYELVSRDDPAIYLEYPNQKDEPVLGGKEPDPTHSALYGLQLQVRCRELGVGCDVVYPGHHDSPYANSNRYLIEQLTKR